MHERYLDYMTLIAPGSIWIVEFRTNHTQSLEGAHWAPYDRGHIQRVIENAGSDICLPGSRSDALQALLLMSQDGAQRGRPDGVVMRALYDLGKRERIIIPLPT